MSNTNEFVKIRDWAPAAPGETPKRMSIHDPGEASESLQRRYLQWQYENGMLSPKDEKKYLQSIGQLPDDDE